MKRQSSALHRQLLVVSAAALAAMLTFSRPAHAESADLAGILEILEGAIFERLFPSGGAIALGGCQVEVKVGFPTTELRFQRVGACKLEGTVRLGILPLSASVRLVIYDTPQLEALDADIMMRLKFKPMGLDWSLANGRATFRLTPQSPATTRALTGQGTRSRPKTGFVASGRFNLFDPASGSGQALLRNVQGGVRSRQVCSLSGAQLADPMSGALANCVAK